MAEGRTDRGASGAPEPRRQGEPAEGLGPFVDRVRQRVSDELNARKDRASEALAGLADTVRRIGEPLHGDSPLEPLGAYTDEAAARLERVANDMKERDVSELADEVRGLARRRPAAFAAAGFAAGLLAARFLKSSAADTARPRTAARRRAGAGGPQAAGGARESRRERQSANARLDTTADRTTK